MSHSIDVKHLGRAHVICAYEVDGLVVDPGPASCLGTLLDGLQSEPRALLLTHIHLDHAGATGVLMRRYPHLTVYVHEAGAAHLADPSKLLESAGRLYGDRMEELWGEVAPADPERLQALRGGETVEGMRVAYTPGHASHHVCFLHEDTGDAYVGDMAGVRLPGHPYTVAPTPPPDIDVEAWLESADAIEAWAPSALCLTHFGRHEDVPEQLARVRESLRTEADRARELSAEEFAAWSESEARGALDPATADSLLQAAPPDQLGLGLRRYWDKKASA
ncbi:MAG: MBL fold metallo-hydrolase [Thermoleophilaceae bacterium]|nr:MBL fold metallo-hydrolase [Thermoleophilaceae bacterium]